MDANEDGLTLVEMMVALLVLGVVLSAMASVAINSLQSIQQSEQVVHSTQLGNEVLEEYLALPYDSLGHYSTSASEQFGADFEDEELVVFPDPEDEDDVEDQRVPPERNETRSGVEYTVETAVTWIDDPATDSAQDYKRITVLLSWERQGAERTARTQATRSPAPDDQPLTVTIEPDLMRLKGTGATDGAFTVTVVAREPQSAVSVEWDHREGGQAGERPLTTSDDLTWSVNVPENSSEARFANGNTLFYVEGRSKANETVSTTIGRALFVHDIQLLDLATDPNQIVVSPDGVCDGLDVSLRVVGAIASDPLTLTFEGAPEDEAIPFDAADSPVDGTLYHLELDSGDLPVEYGSAATSLEFDLDYWRSADPNIDAGAHEERNVSMTIEDVAECPA